MCAFMRNEFGCNLLPECFTGLSIQTHNDKHVFSIRVCNAKDTLKVGLPVLGVMGRLFCIDGCKYKLCHPK